MSNVVGTIDYGDRGRVVVVEDAAALAQEAAQAFIEAVAEAVLNRGGAAVALSGGSTPKAMGSLLAKPEFSSRVPWDQVNVFWGDERWVPLYSLESNAGEALRVFLNRVGAPEERVHPFATEDVTPDESAAAYEALIKSSVLSGESGIPVFDLILLGMGDDGHTASLFPGTSAVREAERLVVAHNVPKLNATRLTFTPPLINAARSVVFLAAGAGKAERLAEVLDGDIDLDRLPSQVVRPANGPIWLVDRAAITKLARQPES
jgi:6-phosphogluconolactonase